MKEIIENAIAELRLMGVEPNLINLTDDDYQEFVKEVALYERLGIDWVDGYEKRLQFYEGVEIDCRLPDEDEVKNPLVAQSHICSRNIYQKSANDAALEQVQWGRAFNLRTLEEII